jgi:hypothetical protein
MQQILWPASRQSLDERRDRPRLQKVHRASHDETRHKLRQPRKRQQPPTKI